MSPVYIPAEKVVLHQHVLDALLQGLLLLLQSEEAQGGRALPQPPHPPQPSRRKAGRWAKDQPPPPTSLFIGSSQSWERLKAKQQRTLEGRKGKLSVTLRSAPSVPLPQGHQSRVLTGAHT